MQFKSCSDCCFLDNPKVSVQQLIHLHVLCDAVNNYIMPGAMPFALENYHLYCLAKTVSDFRFNY